MLWWKKSWIEHSLPTLSQNCQYLASHKMSHPALPGYHPAHCNKKKSLKICTLHWLLLPQPWSKTQQSMHQYKRQKIPPRADLRGLWCPATQQCMQGSQPLPQSPSLVALMHLVPPLLISKISINPTSTSSHHLVQIHVILVLNERAFLSSRVGHKPRIARENDNGQRLISKAICIFPFNLSWTKHF